MRAARRHVVLERAAIGADHPGDHTGGDERDEERQEAQEQRQPSGVDEIVLDPRRHRRDGMAGAGCSPRSAACVAGPRTTWNSMRYTSVSSSMGPAWAARRRRLSTSGSPVCGEVLVGDRRERQQLDVVDLDPDVSVAAIRAADLDLRSRPQAIGDGDRAVGDALAEVRAELHRGRHAAVTRSGRPAEVGDAGGGLVADVRTGQREDLGAVDGAHHLAAAGRDAGPQEQAVELDALVAQRIALVDADDRGREVLDVVLGGERSATPAGCRRRARRCRRRWRRGCCAGR